MRCMEANAEALAFSDGLKKISPGGDDPPGLFIWLRAPTNPGDSRRRRRRDRDRSERLRQAGRRASRCCRVASGRARSRLAPIPFVAARSWVRNLDVATMCARYLELHSSLTQEKV